jgi:hypothetical protein
MNTQLPLDSTTPTMPTVSVQKPPTLPMLIAQQVQTDRNVARIERSQWYILAFLILMDALLFGLGFEVYLLSLAK